MLRAAASTLLLFAGVAAADSCDLKAKRAPDEPACARQWMDENLRLNDLTSVGTHNSYKLAIPDAELELLRKRSTRGAIALDYAHRPLVEQLNDGARQLELDVYIDSEGGRFADPAVPRLTGAPIDPAMREELRRPGFKVMHIPDFDFRANCISFIGCLRTIKDWSDAHPDHVPLLILINAKDGEPSMPGGTPIAQFDTQAFDAFDAEIRSVLSAEDLITPDQVQGKFATLREAVLAGNWPKLRDARGKILIALDDNAKKVAIYRGARRSLEGRAMFINTDESSAAAAYLTLNEPLSDARRIRAAVEAGFLVRTRADADTAEARSNETARRDAALTSGAQYISTDYMQPDRRFGPYTARLPDGATTVCNPVRQAQRCGSHAVGR